MTIRKLDNLPSSGYLTIMKALFHWRYLYCWR